jgi:hypothetical protein
MAFRLRFRLRVDTRLASADRELSLDIAGRSVRVRSEAGAPFRDSEWVVIDAAGFSNAEDAQGFGQHLRQATVAAAAERHAGVDVGDDEASIGIAPIVKDAFREQTGFVLREAVHGLAIYPDGDQTKYVSGNFSGSRLINAEALLEGISDWYVRLPPSLSPGLVRALRLRAEANIIRDSFTQVALAFASVEALAPRASWTPEQHELLRSFVQAAEDFDTRRDGEGRQIARRLEAMLKNRLTVGESIRILLNDLGLGHLQKLWDNIYNIRSRILHGDIHTSESSGIFGEALDVSHAIVMAAVEREIA